MTDRVLFRFHSASGRNLLSAAIYNGARRPFLVVWVGSGRRGRDREIVIPVGNAIKACRAQFDRRRGAAA